MYVMYMFMYVYTRVLGVLNMNVYMFFIYMLYVCVYFFFESVLCVYFVHLGTCTAGSLKYLKYPGVLTVHM